MNLLDDISITCPGEQDVLLVRLFFDNAINDADLMAGFITFVLPWKDKIMARDEAYFRDNDHMFGPLPYEKVQHFKRLYTNGTFTAQDKIVIWNYFLVFITLIEQVRKINK